MCYFMHIVIDHKIPESEIEKYSTMDIDIKNITMNVENMLSEKFYYDITNQCSCDFITSDPKRNQANVLKKLYPSFLERDKVYLISSTLRFRRAASP